MPRYSRTESMNLNDLFQKAKSEYLSSSDSARYIALIDSLDELMGEHEYEIDNLRNDEMEDIKELYLQKENESKLSQLVFDKIVKMSNPILISSQIAPTKLYKKANHFTHCVDFHEYGSAYSSRSQSSSVIDRYLPDECRFLKGLETVAVQSKQAIGEYLVTGYHESGLSRSQYIAQLVLFGQLEELYGKSPFMMEKMIEYLIEYERMIAKPLPHTRDTPLNIPKYSDSSTIITNYMVEINNGIKKFFAPENAKYPTQFDVFFVAPDTHQDLNLHALNTSCYQQCTKLNKQNNDGVDGVSGVYRLLREAALHINNAQFGQRYIMLIVRGNKEDSDDDTIYIFKPNTHNSIPNGSIISDYVELLWLLNSKSDIVPALASNAEGVLGFTHHLHSQTCNKTYLSYGDYKSRVFKRDLLHKLQILMECEHENRSRDNDKLGEFQRIPNKKGKKSYMSYMYLPIEEEEETQNEEADTTSVVNRNSITKKARTDFDHYYHEFPDEIYYECGKYWFSNDVTYECYEPYCNPSNCRAMGNIFIPKSCTHDLSNYIVETFDSVAKLYYNLDYTVAMQNVDKQTVFFEFPQPEHYKSFGVVPTELHHKKSGELLYAIIVPNNLRKNQIWKIKEYHNISEAFMTAKQLVDKHGIFINDLPKGSKAKHNYFAPQLNNIQVYKSLIMNTEFNTGKIHIVQSKQTVDKLRRYDMERNDDTERGEVRLSEMYFKSLAVKALEDTPLTSMAYVQFRKHQYRLEKLLPVRIPEYDRYVAISFCYDEENQTHATGLCFDMIDMKNKANLVSQLPSDSWLNYNSNQSMIKLTITKQNIPRPRQRTSRPPSPEIQAINNTKHKPQVVNNTMQHATVPQYLPQQMMYNSPFLQAQQQLIHIQAQAQQVQYLQLNQNQFYPQQTVSPYNTIPMQQNYGQLPYGFNGNCMPYYPQ